MNIIEYDIERKKIVVPWYDIPCIQTEINLWYWDEFPRFHTQDVRKVKDLELLWAFIH